MELILIRHSATAGNLLRRYIGITDEPLCAEGIKLARQRKSSFPEASLVYISPLLRCRQTAEIIYPDIPAIIIENLRETDFGSFENKSYSELKDEPGYQKWLDSGGKTAFPGGESMELASGRMLRGFDELLSDLKKRSGSGAGSRAEGAASTAVKRAAAIVHGGTIMAIMSARAKPRRDYYEWQLKNCEGFLLSISDDFKAIELVREYRI